MVLAGFELNRAVGRLIYEEHATPEYLKQLMGSMFLFQLIVFGSLSVLGIIIGPYVLQSILNDIPFFPYITLTFLFVPFQAIVTLYKVYLQATHQGLKFMKMDLLFWASNVGLNLLFVITFHMKVEGLLLSTVISCFAFALYAFFIHFRKTTLRINKQIMSRAFHFSLPILPFIIAGTFLESIDKMVLNNQSGKDAAGIYYIAVMVAAFFSVLKESAISALQPWFYQHFEKQPPSRTRDVLQTVYLCMAVLAIFISWFSYDMLHFLSSKRELLDAWHYVPYIVNALLFVFLSQLETLIVYYRKQKIRWLIITTLLALIVNWEVATHLVPVYGITGAAISYMCAMFVLAISTIAITWSLKLRFNYLFIGGVSLVSFLLSIIPQFVLLSYGLLLASKIILSMLLSLLLYFYLQHKYKVRHVALQWLKSKLNIT